MALLSKIAETDFEKRLRRQTETASSSNAVAELGAPEPQPPPPSPSDLIAASTPPCPACRGTRFWVDRYQHRTHCHACDPCPAPSMAEFAFRVGVDDSPPIEQPNAELAELDPEPDPPGLEFIDLADVKPCPKCGSLIAWWNPLGRQRCMNCEPPVAARRALRLAAMIRARKVRKVR